MGSKLIDVFGNELKRGNDNLELSASKVIIEPVNPEIEKRYMKLVLSDYKKSHPVMGFFKSVYHRLMSF